MDKKDIFSIVIAVVSIILIGIILYYLPKTELTTINIITIIGSITSPAGVLIAVIQIFKIKSNNTTFLHTLRRIENNSIIDIISRSIEQVRLIKVYFDMEKSQDSRSSFNILRNDLNEISFVNKVEIFRDRLAEFTSFCSEMETQIFDGSLDRSREVLSEKFTKLTELESLLQEIKSVVKKPEKDNL